MSSEITRINPSQLHPTPGYHHVTVVEAGRMAFLAGQCPLDLSGALVGPGDLDAQIDQVAANAIAALGAVGAGPDQVVRSVIYVVSDDRSVLGAGCCVAASERVGAGAGAHQCEHAPRGCRARLCRAADRGRSDGRTARVIAGCHRRQVLSG
jgi:enamine deaminase RidA (YjgF/YER057c/UK114 family)